MDITDTERPSIKQSINNNSGQAIQVGNVGGDFNQTFNTDIKTDDKNIEYRMHRGDSQTFRKMYYNAGYAAIPGLLLAALHITGSLSSIFSLIPTPPSKSLYILFIFAIGIISLVATLYFLITTLRVQSGERIYMFFRKDFLDKKDTDNAHFVRFTSKCKTGKCDGTIHVVKVFDNEEDVTYAGVCSNNDKQHIYSFDETELIGEPIKLTRKKSAPNQSN